MRDEIRITAMELAEALTDKFGDRKADRMRTFSFQQPTATLSKCRSCHAPIFWGRLDDRPHPFDLDGVSHFATCPDADRWRRDSERRAAAARDQGKLL